MSNNDTPTPARPESGDLVRGPKYAVITRKARHALRGEPHTLGVYLCLLDFVSGAEGTCWPSYATISEDAGVSPRQVGISLSKLEDLGLVHREARSKSGGRASNLYTVASLPKARDAIRVDPQKARDAIRVGHVVPEGRARGAHEEELVKKNYLEEEPSLSLALVESPIKASCFADFWDAYPQKTGKIEAEKAFKKAAKKADASEIVDGARRYREDPNRSDAYTKGPAAWLNAGRWMDEPLPARARTSKAATNDDAGAAIAAMFAGNETRSIGSGR